MSIQETLDYLAELDERKLWKELQRKSEQRARLLFAGWMSETSHGKNSKIDAAMIEQAKQHPIENLIAVNKRFASCVWHQDGKKPNMEIKNNKARCWSCGKRGDAIDVYQATHGGSFQDAVIALR